MEGFGKAFDCYKHSLIAHSGVSLENQNAERDCRPWRCLHGDVAPEGLEGNKCPFGNWFGEHLFCTLAKNLMCFVHVPGAQVRLNSKVWIALSDRNFQARTSSRLSHGYCSSSSRSLVSESIICIRKR